MLLCYTRVNNATYTVRNCTETVRDLLLNKYA